MKKQSPKKDSPDFDLQDIRYYMQLSPKEKLDYLEKMNRFLNKITPKKSKDTAKKLREMNF